VTLDGEPAHTAGEEPGSGSAPSSGEPPLRTRAGLAWVGVCAAAVLAAALIVFVAQNTQKAHVSFLWLDGDASVAVVVLLSAVSGSVVTAAFGTARIVQLRRAVRRRR
jgi:uncharacterized integral membrane protein